jgi:uncharacterized protein
MKTLAEIREILRARADELHERYGMYDLAVFGSVVHGVADEHSDVDVLVSLEQPLGLLRLIHAENYLTELIGTAVDLVPRNEIRPELRERILDEAMPV